MVNFDTEEIFYLPVTTLGSSGLFDIKNYFITIGEDTYNFSDIFSFNSRLINIGTISKIPTKQMLYNPQQLQTINTKRGLLKSQPFIIGKQNKALISVDDSILLEENVFDINHNCYFKQLVTDYKVSKKELQIFGEFSEKMGIFRDPLKVVFVSTVGAFPLVMLMTKRFEFMLMRYYLIHAFFSIIEHNGYKQLW